MKEIIIYTDGACSGNPGKGGYGAILMFNDKKKEISEGYELTTNNRMEMLAVIEALKLLKERCKVTVTTDSKYIVDAINLGWAESWKKKNWMRTKTSEAANSDLWKEMFEEISKHEIEFRWVKGHDGNVHNERCDFLATSALKNNNLLVDKNYINKYA